jgi:multidrug efflux pump subunit AcrA (membrane-fusion protein)
VKLLAPISGLVAIRQNRPNFYFPGMQIPDVREGDQLNPGVPVADVLDLSELEVLARVGELDRANLREGQEAILQLDAIPGQRLNGKIKSMSGTATSNIFSSDPAKKFDVVFSVDMKQLFSVLGVKPAQIQKLLAISEANRNLHPQAAAAPPAQGAPASEFTAKELEEAKLPPPPEEDSQFDVLLRPGLLADVEIIVDRIPNAISLPTQAVFEKDGQLVAYVKNGNSFEARPFKPLKRSESTMVVASGLQPGETVALADPTAPKDDKRKGAKPDNGGAMEALPAK